MCCLSAGLNTRPSEGSRPRGCKVAERGFDSRTSGLWAQHANHCACNVLAVHVQLHWSEHQGMRTHAQLRSAATETKSSQPLCGSKMSILSSEDHYSRDPVQVQSSTRAMFTITSNANKPFYGVIKLDMESNHRADTKDFRFLSNARVL